MSYGSLTVDQLRIKAKALGIKGAWKMRRQDLLEAIRAIEREKVAPPSNKQRYIDSLEIGRLIAFSVPSTEKVLSGKVIEIDNDGVSVETKNGVKFIVKRKNILWVKTGDRWPKGIYAALKGPKEYQKPFGNRHE